MVQFRNNSPYDVTLNLGFDNGTKGGFGFVLVPAGQTWEQSFASEQPLSIQWQTSPTTLSLNPGVNQTVTVAVAIGAQVQD